jgi:Arc/MetJ-type ribon-helix-helix transcriptional regulator
VADTEKITINMSVVDLGKIYLLVDQGYFSSRSDLIRTAIREKLAEYEETVKETVTRRAMMVGVMVLLRRDLEKDKLKGIKRSYTVVGRLSIARDVTPELALETIEALHVYGVLSASAEVKKALGDRIH